MAEDYVKVFLPKLRQLLRLRNDLMVEEIKKLDKNSLKFIIEGSFNILKGVIPLSKKMTENAKRRKHLYKSLGKTSLSSAQKRRILYENPSFCKSIIRRILETFSG